MPSNPEARHRLAELMEARQRELRLRWQDVAETGNVSLRALQAARLGDAEIRPLTQRGIEDGLRWPAGYIQAVLDGKEPNLGGDAAHPPASASTRPEPPPDEPPEPVPPAVASAISSLVASLTPAIEVEVRRTRMRNPDATGADIFTSKHEATIWDLDAPEPWRIGIIAFLRATRTQREAGNAEPNSSPSHARLHPHVTVITGHI